MEWVVREMRWGGAGRSQVGWLRKEGEGNGNASLKQHDGIEERDGKATLTHAQLALRLIELDILHISLVLGGGEGLRSHCKL